MFLAGSVQSWCHWRSHDIRGKVSHPKESRLLSELGLVLENVFVGTGFAFEMRYPVSALGDSNGGRYRGPNIVLHGRCGCSRVRQIYSLLVFFLFCVHGTILEKLSAVVCDSKDDGGSLFDSSA